MTSSSYWFRNWFKLKNWPLRLNLISFTKKMHSKVIQTEKNHFQVTFVITVRTPNFTLHILGRTRTFIAHQNELFMWSESWDIFYTDRQTDGHQSEMKANGAKNFVFLKCVTVLQNSNIWEILLRHQTVKTSFQCSFHNLLQFHI